MAEGETMMHLKLTEEEVYLVDLVQLSTLIREIEVKDLSDLNQPVEASWNRSVAEKAKAYREANKSLWYHQDYFVYSNHDQDCLLGSKISEYFWAPLLVDRTRVERNSSYFEKYLDKRPYNLTCQQTLSRSLKFYMDRIFVVSTYFQVFNDMKKPDHYLNVMETKSIKYNETELSEVKDVLTYKTNRWSPPAVKGQPWQMPDITCVNGYYVAAYSETIYACVSYLSTNESEIYIFRSLIKKAVKIDKISADQNLELFSDFRNGTDIKMVVEPTMDNAFELILYVMRSEVIWILNFNRDDMFNLQSYYLGIKNYQIDYAMRTILIFFSVGPDLQLRSYYLKRSPGSKFNRELITRFADARYLKTLYSNENIEIIVEMYKIFMEGKPQPGSIFPITHLLYKFNLVNPAEMGIQISTQIFNTLLRDDFYGVTLRVDSYSMLDMIILNNAVLIRKILDNNFFQRTSIILNIDAATGFGCTSNNNQTYSIYPTLSEYDPYTNQYFMTPFKSNFKVNNTNKRCDFLRHRVVRPFIKFQYNPIIKTIYKNASLNDTGDEPNLVLAFYDTKLNAVVFRLNITFNKQETIATQPNTIWRGSNQNTFQVNPNFEQRSIDVDLLVRGNFIMRVNPNVTLNPVAAFPYYSASLDETYNLTDNYALFKTENYRIKGFNDLGIPDLENVYAFAKTFEKEIVTKYILIKSKSKPEMLAYEIQGNHMKPINSLKFNPGIKKVFPVGENSFIIFDTNGGINLFYSHNFTIQPLPFPGVNCLDLELVAHVRIKPAFLCFNANLEFVMYYIDQLIARSLTNLLHSIQMRRHPRENIVIPPLTHQSRLLISEFYPGKVFIYHPDAKKKAPNFSMYYLDLEEHAMIAFVKDFTLYEERADRSGFATKIQSLEFVEDRLVVHYRATDFTNFISVYKIDFNFELKELKFTQIPSLYGIPTTSTMQIFRKHFQSSMYANTIKPYLLLAFTIDHDKGVLVIDAFNPLQETFPAMLLPKNSEGCLDCNILLFTYYVASLERTKYYSAGLLHYSKNIHNIYRDPKRNYYLFQLIDADKPKLFFTLKKSSLASYQNLFKSFKSSVTENRTFAFESHLLAMKNQPSRIELNLSIQQKNRLVDASKLKSKVVTVPRINLEDKFKLVNISAKNPEVIMYDPKFYEIPEIKSHPIFDWQMEPESLFETAVGTFKFIKPLEEILKFRSKDVSGILNVDTFCRAYKLNKARNDLICIKTGWIFFHETEIEIFYTDQLKDLDPSDSIRFRFNVNQCTENVVVNHTLVSVCTHKQTPNLVITNLLDLSQNFTELPTLSIAPRVSVPRILKTYENVFIYFQKRITDELNIQGIANIHYFMHKLELNQIKTNTNELGTPILSYLIYFYGVDSKLTDTALGAGKVGDFPAMKDKLGNISDDTIYRVSSVNINTGNLVYAQVFEESSHIGPLTLKISDDNSTESETKDKYFKAFERITHNNIKIGVVKINASIEVRKVIFNRASINNLVFNKEDADCKMYLMPGDPNYKNFDNETIKDLTLFQRFVLIHFPSYHSYVYRYQVDTSLTQVSFFKLENPFAEIENKHWNNRPVCHKWACILVSTFDHLSFVRVYDMRYEELMTKAQKPNFKDIFGQSSTYGSTSFQYNKDVASQEKDSINLDEIPANYTIQPIQILNVTNLQLIRFDTTGQENEVLTLMVFLKPDTIKIFNLNRKSQLVSNNLYFTSRYIDVRAASSYNTELKYRFHVEKFLESDFYKYLMQIIAIAILTVSLAVVYFKYLKTEQIRVRIQDHKEAEQEEEMKRMFLSELQIILNKTGEKQEVASDNETLARAKKQLIPKLDMLFAHLPQAVENLAKAPSHEAERWHEELESEEEGQMEAGEEHRFHLTKH